jgi:hypothetical protein
VQVSGFATEGRILSSQLEFVSVERLLASERLAGRTVNTFPGYKGLISAVSASTGDVSGVVVNVLNSNTQVGWSHADLVELVRVTGEKNIPLVIDGAQVSTV